MLSLRTLPWYIYQYIKTPSFLSGFIMYHNIERFSRPFEGQTVSLTTLLF